MARFQYGRALDERVGDSARPRLASELRQQAAHVYEQTWLNNYFGRLMHHVWDPLPG